MIYITVAILVLLTVSGGVILNHPKFGQLPSGERLDRIKKSPNYKDGSFQNQSFTPVMAENVSYFSALKEFFFDKNERSTPIGKIPSKKTDLLNLDINKNVLVWFGHSSYFMQIDGKKILVDPVLSSHASPFSFTIKAFDGSCIYTAEDIPEIDYLFISHDHWDHLDYEAITQLKPKIKNVICGLGTGEHFESWGYSKGIISEMDWYEHITPDAGFTVHSVPARHFSGRGFKRNQSLWSSFVLQTPSMKIFIGGDSGYDKHFAEFGKNFGPIDLAILENGQYDHKWKYIHTLPEQIPQIFSELQAKRLFAVHSSKFVLANHAWDEPMIKLAANSKKHNIPLITPMIGEEVNLNDTLQQFTEWWTEVD